MKSIVIIASCLAAMSLAACAADKPETKTAPKTIETAASNTPVYDIGGLKIGMSQSEVESIAVHNGYAPKNRSGSKSNIFPGLSFKQLVKKRQGEFVSMNPQKHEGIGTLSFHKEDREFLDVTFTAFKDGARVTTVNYRLKDSNMGKAQFEERAFSKYGAPAGEQGLNGTTWLGAQNYKIDGIPVKERLRLTSLPGNNLGLAGNSLGLQGIVNQKAYGEALDAAIPKSTGGTTF